MEAKVKENRGNTFNQDEKTKRKKYSSEQLIKALRNLKEEKYTITEAAKIYNIPRQTLANKLFGKSPAVCSKPGPEAVLGKDVEQKIVDWILNNYRRGFFLYKEGLLYSVKTIIERRSEKDRQKLPFKNNTPGKGWYCSFRKRHPIILEKYNEFSKLKHNSTADHLNYWFAQVETILEEDDAEDTIFDPSRIYIMDELIIKLVSKNQLILCDKKRSTHGNMVSLEENELSFLFAANAAGEVAPLMVMTKSKESSEFFSNLLKNEWQYENTDSGAVGCETFYKYVVDYFYPHLQNTQNGVPIAVFLGCDFPHLSLPLSNFCQTNGLSMICLPRNSKDIQSLNSTVYNVLNTEWKRQSHPDLDDNNLTLKWLFLTVLHNSVKEKLFTPLVIQRFQINKLYPFKEVSESFIKDAKNYSRNSAIDYMEKNIPREMLVKFRHCRVKGISWNDDVQYSALYDVWLAVVNDSVANDFFVEEGKSSDVEEESDIGIEYI